MPGEILQEGLQVEEHGEDGEEPGDGIGEEEEGDSEE